MPFLFNSDDAMEDMNGNGSHENRLIAFFRSEYFVLITFLTAITPFMAHTASLLLQVSSIKSTWYSYFFAFSFDLAVFAFSINGRRTQATGLAFIVFILNVCFFNLDTISEMADNRQVVRLFVTVVISGAGSWILHSYVVFFNEKIGERKEFAKSSERYQRELQKKTEQVAQRDKVIQQLQEKLAQSDDQIRSLLGQVDRLADYQQRKSMATIDLVNLVEHAVIQFPFTCKMCEQTALTQKSLEGMVSYCKNKQCKYKAFQSMAIEELETINP